MELEFARNRERYQFMKWGCRHSTPSASSRRASGIIHQVNLEYLFRGVRRQDTPEGVYYPDTLVGTDNRATMINAVGVVGWGVGGIEAEAAMLGQPIYFLTPDVVEVELVGSLPEVTATDLVLTITEMLRKAKWSGQFVEFFGEGAASERTGSRHHRQHGTRIRRDHGTNGGQAVEYLRATGRTEEEIAALRRLLPRRPLRHAACGRDRLYTRSGSIFPRCAPRSPARNARRTASSCRR